MNAKLTHLTQLILSAIISLLGFSSCKPSQEQYDMYGAPIIDYQLKGRVTDTENNPIAGLRVVIARQGYGDADPKTQTLTTDANGEFVSEKTERTYNGYNGTLTFTDIDGDDNGGEFQEKTINLQELRPVLDKSKAEGWYEGVYIYTVNTTLLKEYKADE